MKYKKITAALLAAAVASSLALSGCGSSIDQSATGATIGDEAIELGYMNFVAHYWQMTYDSIFVTYYGEDYWTNEDYVDDDGLTMEDSVKEYVLEEIELQYLLEAHMDDYGVEITEDDLAEIAEAAEAFMADNTDEAISALGATQAYVEQMLYYQTVSARMEEAIEATADGQLSIEDYSRRTFTYIAISIADYTDDDGETVSYTDEEIAAMSATIEEFIAAAAEDYETALEDYGFTAYTYSYGEDEESEEDGGFADAVIEVADTLSEGEVSGVIESGDYLFAIRLDSEDDQDAAQDALDTATATLASEIYTEVTEGYQEESDFTVITKLWKKVRFTTLFTAAEDEE